jgi:deoxyuridine 5'-triphosphate nucleotidohydrolase
MTSTTSKETPLNLSKTKILMVDKICGICKEPIIYKSIVTEDQIIENSKQKKEDENSKFAKLSAQKSIETNIQKLPSRIFFKLSQNSKMPTRNSPYNSGLYLYSSETTWIFPNTRKLIKTGLQVLMPEKFCGQIFSLNALAINNSIDVVTTLIDPEFDGEIKVLLINNGIDLFEINLHDAIAQLVVFKIDYPNPVTFEYFAEESYRRWVRKEHAEHFGFYWKNDGYHRLSTLKSTNKK